jgi:hypothetical protein
LAHYNIIPDNNTDIFNAYLERYDGKTDHEPPTYFFLIRGESQWSGSIEEQSLLNKIGEVIDRRTKGRLHFIFDSDKKQERKGRQR